jgi:hypothetical protein
MDEQDDHSGEAFTRAVEEGAIDAADPELFGYVERAEGAGGREPGLLRWWWLPCLTARQPARVSPAAGVQRAVCP